jgi:ribonuclease Y
MHIFTAVKFNFSTLLIGMFLAAVIGYFIGYFLRKLISQYQIKEAEAKKIKIVEEAEHEAQRRLKVAAVEAKEQALILRTKVEKEVHDKLNEVRDQEQVIKKREQELRGSVEKARDLEKQSTDKMEEALKIKQLGLEEQARYSELSRQEMVKLENIGFLTANEAKDEIRKKVTDIFKLYHFLPGQFAVTCLLFQAQLFNF